MSELPTITFVHVTPEEERRLVHILAALREHLKDELRYETDDPTDPRNTPLALRDELRLHTWLWNELTNLMILTYGPEAEAIDPPENTPVTMTRRYYNWSGPIP